MIIYKAIKGTIHLTSKKANIEYYAYYTLNLVLLNQDYTVLSYVLEPSNLGLAWKVLQKKI